MVRIHSIARTSIAYCVFAISTSPVGMIRSAQCAPPSPDDAAAAIRAFGSFAKCVSWKAQTTQAVLTDPADAASVESETPYVVEGVVRFDITTRRYWCEFSRVTEWLQGYDPHLGTQAGFSFDGETYRFWDRSSPGASLPTPADPAKGLITTSEKVGHGLEFYDIWMRTLGADFLPPFTWTWEDAGPHELSDLITNPPGGGEAAVSVLATGVWSIRVPLKFADGDSYAFVFDFDATRGCLVSGEWLNGQPEKPWKRFEVDVEKSSSGMYLPREVRVIPLLDRRIVMTRIKYDAITLDTPVTSGSFEATFPPGTHVDDFLTDRSYVVGYSLDQNAQAIRDFVRDNQLQKSEEPSLSSRLLLIMANIAIVAAVTIAYLLFSRRRPPRGSANVMVAIGFGCASVTPAIAISQETPAALKSDIHVMDCGLNACLFILEAFEVPYEARIVREALPASEQGVSALNVANVLMAHGLSVDARRGLTVNQLKARVNKNTIGILPLSTAGGKPHYFCVATNSQGALLLVDVLRGIRPLEAALTAKAFQAHGGTVLFIERDLAVSATTAASHLVLEPTSIDLGEFDLDGSDASTPKVVDFTITNSGDRPLLIKRVTASCGCTKPDWSGGVLASREHRKLSVKILLGSWTEGRSSRDITFECGDESSTILKIFGSGVSNTQSRHVEILPARIDAGISQLAPNSLGRQITVRADAVTLADLTVLSDKPWLSASIRERNSNAVIITVTLSSVDDLLREAGNRTQGSANVILSSRSGKVGVVPIVAKCHELTLSPRVIHCGRRDAPSRIEVRATYRDGSSPASLELIGATAQETNIQVSGTPCEDGLLLEVDIPSGIRNGVHVLKCIFRVNEMYTIKESCVVLVEGV